MYRSHGLSLISVDCNISTELETRGTFHSEEQSWRCSRSHDPPSHSWAYSSLSNAYTRVKYVRSPIAPGTLAGTLKWPVAQPVPQLLEDFWDSWASQKPICSGKMAHRQERCICEGKASWGDDRLWFYLHSFICDQPLAHAPFVSTTHSVCNTVIKSRDVCLFSAPGTSDTVLLVCYKFLRIHKYKN